MKKKIFSISSLIPSLIHIILTTKIRFHFLAEENQEFECSSCLNGLHDEEYISALGQEWHAECFRCSACDAQLSSWYFEKDGLLFCKNDYWTKFGESCQQCGEVSENS